MRTRAVLVLAVAATGAGGHVAAAANAMQHALLRSRRRLRAKGGGGCSARVETRTDRQAGKQGGLPYLARGWMGGRAGE